MQGFRFALVAVLAFNTAIAALLTLLRYGGGFFDNLVFSQCIGLIVLGVIHLGLRALWPGRKPPVAAFLGLVALGIGAGWLGGSRLAAALLGLPWSAGRADWAAPAVTLAAGIAATWFFWSRQHAAELERGRIEAQLKLLQAQIEPHFLFNTLANLDALIAADPPRAREMLRHFNGYLRATLMATRRNKCPLGEEFALLRDYLEVLAIRMGPRLKYELALPPELALVEIPPLLLQPLVENAVKHGLELSVKGGTVTVGATSDGRTLRLEVADTGGDVASQSGASVGLANLRERLAAAYAGAARVEAGPTPAGGYRVTLSLPR